MKKGGFLFLFVVFFSTIIFTGCSSSSETKNPGESEDPTKTLSFSENLWQNTYPSMSEVHKNIQRSTEAFNASLLDEGKKDVTKAGEALSTMENEINKLIKTTPPKTQEEKEVAENLKSLRSSYADFIDSYKNEKFEDVTKASKSANLYIKRINDFLVGEGFLTTESN